MELPELLKDVGGLAFAVVVLGVRGESTPDWGLLGGQILNPLLILCTTRISI